MKQSFYVWHCTLVLLLMVGLLCSCDHSFLFDREGNCPVEPEPEPVPEEPVYQVRFTYDYNMAYADAFAEQVSSVTLYVIDDSGNIVWQYTEQGSSLAEKGYLMTVPVAPGTYSLLAWGGTTEQGSFTVAEGTVATALQCTLSREHTADGSAYVDSALDHWFYGYTAAQIFPDTEGTYLFDVSLTKDTNLFHVALARADGTDVDASQFAFTITADNGLMDWDNSLLPDEDICYYPWNIYQGESNIEPYTTRGTSAAAIAEITTSRLVKGHDVLLTVTNIERDEVLFSVPLIDYALLIKSNYPSITDDQEFLDREDEWDILFLLDEDSYWLPAVVYINSWRVVLQDTGF